MSTANQTGAITIHTKKTGDTYRCYGTVNGYDYSFSGLTQNIAQRQMSDLIVRQGVKNVKWNEVEMSSSHFERPYHSSMWSNRPKLDNL